MAICKPTGKARSNEYIHEHIKLTKISTCEVLGDSIDTKRKKKQLFYT